MDKRIKLHSTLRFGFWYHKLNKFWVQHNFGWKSSNKRNFFWGQKYFESKNPKIGFNIILGQQILDKNKFWRHIFCLTNSLWKIPGKNFFFGPKVLKEIFDKKNWWSIFFIIKFGYNHFGSKNNWVKIE